MPKLQLRLPKAAVRPEPVVAPTRSGAEVPKKRQAPAPVITAESANQVVSTVVKAVKKATRVVEAKASPPPVQTSKQVQANGVPVKKAKPVVAAVVVSAPPPQDKPKRETRLRGRAEVRKFLPRVQRVSSLRTVRAIGFLEQIEARAVETRRLSKDQKFPMSILEMKALNEAIKIMQVKHKLEELDVEKQKLALANGSPAKPRK